MSFRAIEWNNDTSILRLVDQKLLPQTTCFVDLRTADEVASAIADMTVRGAPAIGVAAAFGMVMTARKDESLAFHLLQNAMAAADSTLRASRPTAVNLFWALDRMKVAWSGAVTSAALVDATVHTALSIEADDIAVNRAISRHAMQVVPEGEAVFFHHCNTGSLATVDLGTALGIIRTAHEGGRKVFAYLDETRPRLQGAKLSSFELMQYGVPHAIVVDGASAHIMRTRKVDLVVVGCDRVAANGDTANKIGTYNLALAAKDNGVPFYVAAPSSTIDLDTTDGDAIHIEERDSREITEINGVAIAPIGAPAVNPAFDVTPARLITGIITEFGIVSPPFTTSLRAVLKR